jgi:hypothetical protein
VTPVVLHRHDIDDSGVSRRLIDAFHHAGMSDDVLTGVEVR